VFQTADELHAEHLRHFVQHEQQMALGEQRALTTTFIAEA